MIKEQRQGIANKLSNSDFKNGRKRVVDLILKID